jgi:hypothetical protein
LNINLVSSLMCALLVPASASPVFGVASVTLLRLLLLLVRWQRLLLWWLIARHELFKLIWSEGPVPQEGRLEVCHQPGLVLPLQDIFAVRQPWFYHCRAHNKKIL